MALPGGRPSGAGLAAGSVWVTTWDGHVVRVDPASHRILARVAVGSHPLAARPGYGSVWVTNGGDGTVSRIDPADNTVLAKISVGPAPYEIARGGGGMWVATQTEAVKIDPTNDQVVRRAPYPHSMTKKAPSTAGVGLAADDQGVWVSTATGQVLHLRPGDGRLIAAIRVLPGPNTSPGAVVVDGNNVWVSNYPVDSTGGPGAGEPRYGTSAEVAEINMSSDRIVARVPSAGYPVSAVLPTGGTLFMVGDDYQSGTSVLMRTDWPYQVLRSVSQVGGGAFDVVPAAGSLWIPSWNEHALYAVPQPGRS
jgi:YVTN family beta-propeller protein